MRVELNVPGSVTEPRMWVKHQSVLAMALRPGSIELGLRRSEMRRLTFGAGEMSLIPRHLEKWFRNEDLHGLCIAISDAALTAASDGTSGEVELRRVDKLIDARLGTLVEAAKCGKDCRVSYREALSRFCRAGACRGIGQRLCSATSFCADTSRRARFRTLAKD